MEKINSLFRFGSMPGLDRIQKLLNKIGNPEQKCKFIHVAGTNGKGSICTMLAEVLQKCGYKTGLFTSPYIIEFRDRIKINGEMIPKDCIAKIAGDIFPFIDNMIKNNEPITEFECITTIAFEYFCRQNCDIVVLETGLGGRFDVTNVISSPITSVITSIGLDHTAILGDSVEKIAMEKSGIIKNNCTTVFCPQEDSVNTVIRNTAKDKNNSLFEVKTDACKVLSETLNGSRFEYKNKEYDLSLVGRYQIKNACTVLETITALKKSGFTIPDSAVTAGLKEAFIPARFEVIHNSPIIILDGGHNPPGLYALSQSIKKSLPDKDIVCIISMLRDKSAKDAMAHLKGMFSKVYIVEIDSPRKMPAKDLKAIADNFFDDVEICLNKTTAVKKSYEYARRKNGAMLVCGSLYLASEIRNIIKATTHN